MTYRGKAGLPQKECPVCARVFQPMHPSAVCCCKAHGMLFLALRRALDDLARLQGRPPTRDKWTAILIRAGRAAWSRRAELG